MPEDENVNDKPQETASEASEDRPVFNPDMILENSYEPDISFPEDDLSDFIENSDEDE